MKKAVGIAVIVVGVSLIVFALLLKCYMFGFSNIDETEHITLYLYTLNGEKTTNAMENYFSDVFAIAKEQAENFNAGDVGAIHAKVYESGPDYVMDSQRTFLDRFYTLFLIAIGAIIVILGINLLSERIDED